MAQPVTSDRLLDLLNREIAQASALLDALHDENDALQQRSAAAIESALERKTQRLSAFEKTEDERRRLLQTLDIGDDNDAVGKFLSSQAGPGVPLARRWTELLGIADECRRQNQVNGALVETQRRHVQRALDILRGAPDSATYGPTGAADRSGGSHTLAKA